LHAAAAGALNTAAQLGTALGVAGLLLLSSVRDHGALPLHGPALGWAGAGLLLPSSVRDHGALPLHGPALGWAGAALLALAGAAVIARRSRPPRQHDHHPAGHEVDTGLGVEHRHQAQPRGQKAGGDDAEGLTRVLHEPERREHPAAVALGSAALQEAEPGR